MSSDSSTTPGQQTPEPGLPPVLPPSGRQILQLFVVPALIVLVLVGMFLMGPVVSRWIGQMTGWASADNRSGEQFLRDLDNTNPEIRYRAASDLAQVLLRKDELARDVDFALGLSERLRKALDNSAEAEKTFAARVGELSKGEESRELAKLSPDRAYITYLTGCLGHMSVPVGSKILSDIALQSSGMEPVALAERRAMALFALAVLGEKSGRYDQLTDEQKNVIEEKLAQASLTGKAASANESKIVAKNVLDHVRTRRSGKPDALGLAETLRLTAKDDDVYVRQLTALAATFWHGNPADEQKIVAMLEDLSRDDGRGTDAVEKRLAKNPTAKNVRAVARKPGFKVQVNATLALARRGSDRVSLSLLEEMLDGAALGKTFVVQYRDGGEKPDESLVAETILNSLRAVVHLHEKLPSLKLNQLLPLIEGLEKSSNPDIAKQAKETRLALRAEG